jgi:peptidoglycan/xylan/chitin deacetylase (PgdA/CDA1 family)
MAALAILVVLLLAGGGTNAHSAAHLVRGGFFERLARLAGSGPGSSARSTLEAENDAIDRTLGYTPLVRIAGRQHRELALMFDDGPGPYTPAIISILARERVPATFFEVGVMEKYFHTSTTEIAASGDAIGDHTYAHAPMERLSARDQRVELLGGATALTRYGAAFPRLFRPPYGLWNSATLTLLRRYRMLMVLWTVDTGDFRRPGVQAIVRATLSGARPGAIVLLHDGGGDRSETVAALPKIIKGLRARGYRLVTVPRLLLDNPPPADQDYSNLVTAGA